jgi:hypothetical protein
VRAARETCQELAVLDAHDLSETVLARTWAGQREVLNAGMRLDPAEHRLLLLVNGYTPLGDLARWFAPGLAADAARSLLDLSLVAPVELALPSARRPHAATRPPLSADEEDAIQADG